MDAQQLDVIVRVAGVTLLVLLAVILVRDDRGRRLSAFFAPLAVCLSGFLTGNTPDVSLRLHGFIAEIAHVASGYTVVFLWWFCLTIFDQSFRPRGLVLAVGLGWLVIASADRGLLGPLLADKGLSWALIAIGFGVIAHLTWRLIRDRAGDLVEARRDARVIVVILLAALLFAELSKEILFGIDWRSSAYTITQDAALLGFIIWLVALILNANTDPLAARAPGSASPVATVPAHKARLLQGEAKLSERLRELIEVERVHLDPDLTFNAFVLKMGASERAVRQFINHDLGYDHFRSFLNAYRTAEARRLLIDPGRADDKLIAIALDSGFASLPSFNRVFRAIAGCAPSAYRAANGVERGASHSLDPAFEERSAGF